MPNEESGASSDSDIGDSSVVDDLVLVSNREPYRHRYERDDDGTREVAVDRPAGGLTAGLDPVMQELEGTWIAWGDGDADYAVADEDGCVGVPPSDPAYTLQRLRLSEEAVRGYYDGYANQALWPLCHTVPCKARFDADHWEWYQQVNEEFADAVVDHLGDPGTVWFQDYHFALAPRIVRERRPGAFVYHFLHIPWPAADVFRICPQREALLAGLLGNDLLGFHLPRYCSQFLECVAAELDEATVDWGAGRVHYDDHVTAVRAFSLGVDADAVRRAGAAADESFWPRFRRRHGIDDDTRVVLGVDRLDYTKGLPERLDMLEHLWERRPELRGAFTYVQKGSESRERIPEYQRLQERVEESVDRVNAQFGTDEWTPVVFTTEMFDFEELCSLYRHSEAALVTPLRDGMNLVAKEYVAAQENNDAVLLLSRLAGAHEQLGDDAVTVDPHDVEASADAIERALAMDAGERRARMQSLRRAVHEHDLSQWLRDVVEAGETEREYQRGEQAREFERGRW